MNQNTDRLPPHDADAEAGALACLIEESSGPRFSKFKKDLYIELFYDLRHRTIFQAIDKLDRDGFSPNLINLRQTFKASTLPEDEKQALLNYAVSLPANLPSPENFPSYLEILKDQAARRMLLRDTSELSALAFDPSRPATFIADASHRLLEAYAANKKNGLPDMVPALEFEASDLPEPPEVIVGVAHQGAKILLGGGSKSYKTWSLLDLSVSVASGHPWLGLPCQPGKVLYINFEIPTWSWKKRIQAVCAAKRLPIPMDLSLWNLRGYAARYDLIIPKIIDATKAQGFSLIILDPIYKIYGAAVENDTSDMAKVMNAIEEVSVQTGAAVAFGAHYSKGNQAGKEAIDRVSGSGVFARDPDSILNFTRHEEENAFSVELTLRNHAPVKPFAVRWEFPLMIPDTELDPAKLKQALAGRKQTHFPDTILEVLGDRSLSSSDWQKDCRSENGTPRSIFYEMLSEVRKCKKVFRNPITGLYHRALNGSESGKSGNSP